MSTEYLSRAIQALLQPLQGSFSSGTIAVRSTADTATLHPGSILCPVLDGSEAESCCVKVEKNPANSSGDWALTPNGAEVTVTSLQGGAHVNLPSGTLLRFDEPDAGVSPTATVATRLSGGTRLDEFGTLRQVRVFKDIGSKLDQQSFFAAKLGEYPAAVLSWAATTPGDGSVSPSLGSDATRVGRGKRIYCHEWGLFLISSRIDSADRRRREGDVLRDRVIEQLSDCKEFRGLTISTPNGVKINDARPVSVTDRAYVDIVRFTTWFVLERQNERTFREWRRTSLTAPPVTDARFSMP